MFPRGTVALGYACALLALTAALAALASEQNQQRMPIDAAATTLTVRVGKSGLFSFAGHDHEVVAPVVKGSVALDRADLRRSGVSLEIDAAALKVTGKDEPAGDVPEVQRVMLSDRVLDVRRYPTITFHSSDLSLGERSGERMIVRVTGELTLHGMTRKLTLPVNVRLTANQLIAEGKATVRQSDFGIEPVTAGGGTVKVKDQLEIVFRVTARLL